MVGFPDVQIGGPLVEALMIHLSFVPVALLLGFSIIVAAGLLTVDHLLGPKRPNPTKLAPYECGVTPLGGARDRIHVRYFLIGLLFILFDVEVVFLYLWVYLFRDPRMRIFSLVEVLAFLAVLTLGLGYAWRKGALEWE
jgi:NADH-quinone oxidoreductase subunit A